MNKSKKPARPRPAPDLNAQPRERRRQLTEDEAEAVAYALKTLAPRIKTGEAPPQYVLNALLRFFREEVDRRDRLGAYSAVVLAAQEGFPLSSASKARRKTAFDVAAEKLGRSTAWVEDAYKYPSGRKKR